MIRRLRVFALVVVGVVVTMLAPLSQAVAAPSAPSATTIAVNGNSSGQTFDGVGAESAGGGNSRLLTDYPPAEQQQILDYLFTPNYGADLQILKVEVGGDTNSTDGSESSIEHTRGTIACNAGYEWWIMEQAKRRNPNIKLYGLAWGAPGWIGDGNFWSTDTINYLLDWLGCAKQHGLSINYLGGWNERGYNVTWYEDLRSALDAHGYSAVQIVGADSGWDVATPISTDPTFAKAISIIGVHYPCEGGDGGSADTCPGNATAKSTGKPMWASENGSQDMNSGAPALIRSITRGYLDAGLTAYINWPLIAAVYPNLPYDTVGLMTANEPWSGAYEVGENLWATAQITQFSQPGWKFLDDGSGYLGGTESNGSYVTLASPDRKNYSTVIETTTATAPQTVTMNVSGGLPTGAVHVWSTDLTSSDPSTYFAHQQDITPHNGSYTLTVQPGRVYTVSTVATAHKGQAASPPRGSLALPYADDFDHDTRGRQPTYLSQQQGAFEVEPCTGGRTGQCLRQQSAVKPIEWDGDANPYTIGGDLSWQNYTVSTDALLSQPGSVQLMGRVGAQRGFGVSGINEYYLQVSDTGAWSIVKNNTSADLTTLAGGTTTALGTGKWHHLALSFDDGTITASLDGHTLGSVKDSSYATGMVGLGVDGYQTDEFDNFSVTPIGTPRYDTVYRLTNRRTGQAMTVDGTGPAAGVVQATPTADANQEWVAVDTTPGHVRLVNAATGGALELPGSRPGTPLRTEPPSDSPGLTWQARPSSDGYDTLLNGNEAAGVSNATSPVLGLPATGDTGEQWQLTPVIASNVTYVLENEMSGLVMDTDGSSTAAGAGIVQEPVDGGTTQEWKLAPDGNGGYTLTNVGSGMVLDVPGASTTEDVQLAQEPPAGTSDQQWILGLVGEGVYTLENRNSGMLADDSNQSTSADNPIIQWPANGGNNQQWRLVPVG